jgi:transcriptional regulator with XRE-family HTH domain
MKLTRRRTPPPTDQAADRHVAYQIAEDIYDLRTDQGLSQAELAERAGTKQPRISTLESAAGPPPGLPLLLRVAKALGARLVVRLEKEPKEPKDTL